MSAYSHKRTFDVTTFRTFEHFTRGQLTATHRRFRSIRCSHRQADMLRGRRLVEQALQLDENYAAAWDLLGWSHLIDAYNGWSETADESLDLAMSAANRARSIDDSNPGTLALLAFIHLSLRKYDEAFDFGERALTLGPNNSFVAGIAANVALYCNRPEDMVVLLNKAMRLCPI